MHHFPFGKSRSQLPSTPNRRSRPSSKACRENLRRFTLTQRLKRLSFRPIVRNSRVRQVNYAQDCGPVYPDSGLPLNIGAARVSVRKIRREDWPSRGKGTSDRCKSVERCSSSRVGVVAAREKARLCACSIRA